MLINSFHLCYCTNIHVGKNWEEDFLALKKYFPLIKEMVSPDEPMAIGLRVSNESSKALVDEFVMDEFKLWLAEVDGYIFTINGFPYGEFHNTEVKENVHTPDWTLNERKNYTVRLFKILSTLLPEGMEGGISTSPLSYRHWYLTDKLLYNVVESATHKIVEIILYLIELSAVTGKILHLDIEPEPDGIIESGDEFIRWFEFTLQPLAIPAIMEKFEVTYNIANSMVKEHLRICYDVCHFAVEFEDHSDVINKFLTKGIKIGKFQISSALKAFLSPDIRERKKLADVFSSFNDTTYLHQVVAHRLDDQFIRYRDLPYALLDYANPTVDEWRAHYHVPISENMDGMIQSTQDDIITILTLNEKHRLTQFYEVETYTWEVLPKELKIPLEQSISNELLWVVNKIKNQGK